MSTLDRICSERVRWHGHLMRAVLDAAADNQLYKLAADTRTYINAATGDLLDGHTVRWAVTEGFLGPSQAPTAVPGRGDWGLRIDLSDYGLAVYLEDKETTP